MKTYIEFLEPYEKELSKKIKKKGLTITVSGVSGSGKSTAAKAIAQEFKLEYVFAGKIMRNEAEKRGIKLEDLSAIREKEMDYIMDKRNLEHAIKGNYVIDARLSGWCAGDWADVRIFVDSNMNNRVKRVAKRDNISEKEAKNIIEKRDREDNKKYNELYGIDMFDKKIYNIIIDNDNISMDELKKISVEKLKKFLSIS